tara:strand:- start:6616 stop:6852 length:237 start_codon:yes stop_codon:yes gene_type:complete
MNIYKIKANKYFGGTIIVPDSVRGIPLFTTRTAPPEIPEGHYAIWNGRGWSLTTNAPPVPNSNIDVDSDGLSGDSDSA